jgi:transposase InsO family protein
MVYVAFVIDAYARRIVGRRASRTAHAGFVQDALEQALHARRPARPGRRARASQRQGRAIPRAALHGAARRGRDRAVRRQRRRLVRQRPRDNALAETVIGLFEAEVIHRRGPWRGLEAVEFATLEWVDWFNHRRLLEPIGNVPPAEAEARYYAAAEVQALAA